MRKVSIVLVFMFTFVLSGCYLFKDYDPENVIEEESLPGGELLMLLPDDVYVVSESFVFSMEEDSYLGIENQRLHVTSTYLVQNDGEDTSIDISMPVFPLKLYDVDTVKDEDLIIKDNDEVIDLEWRFMNNAHLVDVYESYSYIEIENMLEDKDEYTIDEKIYTYNYTLPQKGENQELTISIPEGTQILQDYYSEKQSEISHALTNLSELTTGDNSIAPTEKVTTGRFFTIGNEATFTYNYDLRDSIRGVPLEIFSEQRCYDLYCSEGYQSALYEFIESEEKSINIYDISEQGHPTTEKLFTFEQTIFLEGNSALTTIEVSYYIDGGLRMSRDEESNDMVGAFIYEFYLDSERYVDENIDVSIVVETPYSVSHSNHVIGASNSIIYNPNNGNYIYFELSLDGIE